MGGTVEGYNADRGTYAWDRVFGPVGELAPGSTTHIPHTLTDCSGSDSVDGGLVRFEYISVPNGVREPNMRVDFTGDDLAVQNGQLVGTVTGVFVQRHAQFFLIPVAKWTGLSITAEELNPLLTRLQADDPTAVEALEALLGQGVGTIIARDYDTDVFSERSFVVPDPSMPLTTVTFPSVDEGNGYPDVLVGDAARLNLTEVASDAVTVTGWVSVNLADLADLTIDLQAQTIAMPSGTVWTFTGDPTFLETDEAETRKAASEGSTLKGTGGDDHLIGRAGKDRLNGGRDDDTLNGAGGKDRLFGGQQDDTLNGGADDEARDRLTGGQGSDTFIFEGDFGRDVIRDFDPLEDTLKFWLIGLRTAEFEEKGDDVLVRLLSDAGKDRVLFKDAELEIIEITVLGALPEVA